MNIIQMPSIHRSYKWFVRVTLPHLVINEKMSKILNWVDLQSILAVLHIGDKTEKEHVHMVITLTSELQKQSLDTRLKQIYGVKGSDYSSKPWDGDESACSYLFHDKTATISANKGYSDDDIERFKKQNESVQKVVELNKSRAPGRCVDRVMQEIRDSGEEWTKHQIAIRLLKKIRDGEMYEPGDFVLRRHIEEIYMRQLSDAAYEGYASSRAEFLISPK